MTLDEFDEALLKWGADMAKWPASARRDGEILLGENPKAAGLLSEMQALDASIDAAAMDQVSAAVIAAKVQQSVQSRAESKGLVHLILPKRILGWGAIAGAGGGVLAAFLPVTTGSSALLTLALGGFLP